MKYIKQYQGKQIKAWEDFYLNYQVMLTLLEPIKKIYKEKLKAMYNKSNESTQTNAEMKETLIEKISVDNSTVDITKVQNKFNEQFILELKKIDYFYSEAANNRIKSRLSAIKEQIIYANSIHEFKIYQDSFEMAIKELYKEITMLQQFLDLNQEAKDKLLGKIKKMMSYFDSEVVIDIENNLNGFLSQCTIGQNKSVLDDIKEECIKLFNTFFIGKYKDQTPKILKDFIKPNSFTQSQSFGLGFFVGLLIFQIFIISVIAYNYDIDMDTDPDFKSVIPMFRTFAVICLYIWILGIDVWIWNNHHICYKVIFQFSNHYSEVIAIYTRAAVFSFILLSSILVYMINRTQIPFFFGILNYIPVHILPLICWGSLLLYLFCPFTRLFNYEGRMYMLDLLTESLGSFFLKPDFRHVWVIDQLTSLIGPMRDMEYTLCYYAYYSAPLEIKKVYCKNTRGIFLFIAFFPNIIRILQCTKIIIDTKKSFPQKYNILKYTLNLMVATLSFLWGTYPIFHPIWLVTSVVSTCYSFFWDIKFDFGFLQKGNNYPLRDQLCYSSKAYYYLVSVLNLFLRFLWLVTLSPEVINAFMRPEILSLVLFSLEIFRRGMWNSVRVETKHIDILKEYRVTNDVELPFVKVNGKLIPNESNLLEVMGMTREDKIKVEIEKLREEKKKIVYASRKINDFEPSSRDKANNDLKEYLKAYHINTEINLRSDEEGNYRPVLSRKI